MQKKNHHHRPRSGHHAMTTRPRNAASMRDVASRAGRAVSNAAGSARRRLTAPDPPAWQDALASVVAGGGTSLLAGYAVRKSVDPKIVSSIMLAGGLVGTFSTRGTLRTASTSVAGAGAGQLALTIMQERALEELKRAMVDAANKQASLPPAKTGSNAALPPPSSSTFDERLAMHQQLADDSERFTEPVYAVPYTQAG